MKVDTSHLAQDDASSHEFSNIMHVGDFVDQGSPDGYVRVVVISAADWEIEQARVAALEADAARWRKLLSCCENDHEIREHIEDAVDVIAFQHQVDFRQLDSMTPTEKIDAAMRFDDAMKGGA